MVNLPRSPRRRAAEQRLPFHRRLRRAAMNRFRVLFAGHRMWQVVVDACLIAAAYYLAFYVRFDAGMPSLYERTMFETIGAVVLIKTAVFVVSGMYDKWWRYLSVRDMEGVLQSVILASMCALGYVYLVQPQGYVQIPRSVAVLDFALTLFAIAGIRLLARSWYERPWLREARYDRSSAPDTVVIVGAGDAGRIIVREFQRGNLNLRPIGLIDDDPRKQHIRVEGVRVIGTIDDLPEILENSGVDEVIIAMPNADGGTVQQIVSMSQAAGVRCRTLPAIHEMVVGSGSQLSTQLRDVQVEDVLGRDQISVDLHSIAKYLTDQVVMVTGAGGSIGSELCRQLARVNPRKLILVDHAENNLFFIEHELRSERGIDNIVPVIADVKNVTRMKTVFRDHKPVVVFHAAAYKHVPMMEWNPLEAVRNNALATRTMCQLSEEAGVERFVLVSTDKAVEPQTVMGQSKALAEWVVQAFAARSFHTRFMAVRFGNVLGSSGSVIPIFKRQIERGGPVTVTHEQMTRFFMTIPEAVQLIIQAGSMGDGGEIFVLDMGQPVRIMDLAKNMIELSGRKLGDDINIEVVGIRPGEKLHEELFAGDEEVMVTSHGKIWRAVSSYELDADWLLDELADLAELTEHVDTEAMRTRLRAIMRPRIDAGARAIPTLHG